ncbi:MAG: hydroxymethylbilane synthase [Bacteroidia bacterium]|nr:hydroxymethylbilane synthase [Bacteroidia bacterium]
MHIKLGTRGSKLALWQTHYVADLLAKGGISTDIVMIETQGDKILDTSLAEIGSKGIFTAELEHHLRGQSIDVAVHSAKDMQSVLDDDLEIIAYSEREQAGDVLVSYNNKLRLVNLLPEQQLGTSSTRRVAMLRHYYPQVSVADVRGNLQTRMRKMEDGHYAGLILAYAGIRRMKYEIYIVEELPTDKFTPAVGQGSIAVEASKDLHPDKVEAIRRLVNHQATALCLQTERAFLRFLQGGCSIPVFGLARLEGDQIYFEGGIISLDGQTMLRHSARASLQEPEELGNSVAEYLLWVGGDKILKEIRAKRA